MEGRGKPESSDQSISIGQPLFHPEIAGCLHGDCSLFGFLKNIDTPRTN